VPVLSVTLLGTVAVWIAEHLLRMQQLHTNGESNPENDWTPSQLATLTGPRIGSNRSGGLSVSIERLQGKLNRLNEIPLGWRESDRCQKRHNHEQLRLYQIGHIDTLNRRRRGIRSKLP
jgi:hypothetical protein